MRRRLFGRGGTFGISGFGDDSVLGDRDGRGGTAGNALVDIVCYRMGGNCEQSNKRRRSC